MDSIRRVIFWTYSRGSWQYDVLCALILAFIFLTPKEYFARPPFYEGEEPNIEQRQPRKGEEKIGDQKISDNVRQNESVFSEAFIV